MDALETRIDRLERDARNWRRIAGLLAAVLIASVACSSDEVMEPGRLVAAGTDSGEIVPLLRVNRLEVVNASGEMVGSFFVGVDNTAKLTTAEVTVVNDKGEQAGSFYESENHAGLVLGKLGEPLVSLSTRDGASILLSDSHSFTTRLSDGSIAVNRISDEGRKSIVAAKSDWMNQEKLTAGLNAISGSPRVAISHTQPGGGIIEVFNTLGNRVASMQAAKDNKGMVAVSGVNGDFSHALAAE